MRVYLDNCCFNRLFDDQRQLRIRLEAEAKLYIQEAILGGKLELVWSYILDYEDAANPFDDMITDEEIKLEGMKALVAALGDLQAERFITLIMRAPFDYTKWQKDLWLECSVTDISREAMHMRASQKL